MIASQQSYSLWFTIRLWTNRYLCFARYARTSVMVAIRVGTPDRLTHRLGARTCFIRIICITQFMRCRWNWIQFECAYFLCVSHCVYPVNFEGRVQENTSHPNTYNAPNTHIPRRCSVSVSIQLESIEVVAQSFNQKKEDYFVLMAEWLMHLSLSWKIFENNGGARRHLYESGRNSRSTT